MATPQPSSDTPIREFLTALASADSAQSAVSASAVAGAMGTSLLIMVAALPTTRSDSIDDRTSPRAHWRSAQRFAGPTDRNDRD